ncbi:hypothetical protein CAEBREN_18985 [Caenorhabditis brenneri]|uniref:Uncharacterized protein n=1 Tax=Caenorhabditis brenneri TaxID=135651 RepID=G0NGP6_CAEBE|nr:hypothetical protein CAEBREN_18985 [Caenorhabditis brenneri]
MQHVKTAKSTADSATPTIPPPESPLPRPEVKKPCFARSTLERFSKPADNQILGVLEAETENCREPEKYSQFFGGGTQEQFLHGIRKALKDWEKKAENSEVAESKVPENGDSKQDPKGKNKENLDVNGNKSFNIQE